IGTGPTASTRSIPRPWIVIVAWNGVAVIPASVASRTSVSNWFIARVVVGVYVTVSEKSVPGATVVFAVGSVTANAVLPPGIFTIELMSSDAMPMLVSL